jgi:hypothetical protein
MISRYVIKVIREKKRKGRQGSLGLRRPKAQPDLPAWPIINYTRFILNY